MVKAKKSKKEIQKDQELYDIIKRVRKDSFLSSLLCFESNFETIKSLKEQEKIATKEVFKILERIDKQKYPLTTVLMIVDAIANIVIADTIKIDSSLHELPMQLEEVLSKCEKLRETKKFENLTLSAGSSLPQTPKALGRG